MGKIILIQDVIEQKVTLQEAKKMGIMYQNEMFSYFDEGCTRFVFTNKDKTKVIKLVKTPNNNHFNELEDEIYQNAREGDKKLMAKTKMVDGFIEQEFCMPIKYGGKRLSMEQIRFAASCRNEVGWTKEDTLVCFDLDEYKNY
jgi:hypothetical protein